MPKAIKKKVRQKDAGSELEVTEKLYDIRDQLREKQKTLVTYGLGVAALFIIGAGIALYQYNQGESARSLESEAYRMYYGQKTSSERYQKALDLFKKAYAKKKSPRALLYIAGANAELKKLDDAITALNEFIRTYSSDKELLPLAYQQLAAVQVRKGDKAGAMKILDTLYKTAGNIYKDYALIETAKLLEENGKKDEATAKYKELTEKFKDSPFFEEAKAKLGEKKEG